MYCNMESRMSEFAIQVKHLDKMYKLYNKPSDRLKEALGSRFRCGSIMRSAM